MAITFGTVFVGLCLGIVCADQSSSKSQTIQEVLRESLGKFDLVTNGTYIDSGEDDSDWSIDLEHTPEVDLHLAMINEIVRHMLQDLTMDDNGCWCEGYSCGCCYEVDIPVIHVYKSACLTLTYLTEAYGVQVILTVDGKVIIDQIITARNPPPICASLPFLSKLASVCLRFTNLNFDGRTFSGCAVLEVKVWKFVVKKINLGCFKIPPNAKNLNVSVVSSTIRY